MQDNETQSGRILVVDDEELNRDMLSRRLRKRGFEVECADGAYEADQKLQASEFDLVLLDIMMPEVDGFQYLEQIRQSRDALQLPVIMATAKDGSEDVVKALKMGANDYVTKPLDFQVVMARVATQLRLKRTTEELARAHRLLQEDLERAARFQQSLLPAVDLKVAGCQFAWKYLPCDALAGDFLNVICFDEKRTAFYILDVCGHGTPAALMSAAVGRALSVTGDDSSVVAHRSKGFIRGSRLDVVPPREVTACLNRQFELDTRDGKYFTIAYAILDFDAGEMTYTLAGHTPQLFLPAGQPCQLLECQGVPVGVLTADEIPEDSFQQKKIGIAPGDRIYLFSDGLPEAANDVDGEFQIHRIRKLVEQTREDSIEDSITTIIDTIRNYCGGGSFADDMSILCIQIGDAVEAEEA